MAVKGSNRKITIGTKEWADSNVNCYLGCSNDCRYCYAKKMAIRFKRKTARNWRIMIPNQKYIDKDYNKRKGRIMFPTSHDITEVSLDNCLLVLKKLISSKNEILITTKPRFKCISKICKIFQQYKKYIQFRFTITSIDNRFLKFWEPGAPSFEERFDSLKYAYDQGYKTSISIEPFLDEDPFILIDVLRPYVTESIWIGKMNYIRNNITPDNEKKYYDLIREINSKDNLMKIVEKAKLHDGLIRIKDSIFNLLENNQNKICLKV